MTDSKAEDPKAERQKALNKAYGEASAALRSAHQMEFNSLMQAAAKKLGFEWQPKKSKEEKAAEQLAALLSEFPHLAADISTPADAPEPVPVEAPDGTPPPWTGSGK